MHILYVGVFLTASFALQNCNSEIMSLIGWEVLWEHARAIEGFRNLNPENGQSSHASSWVKSAMDLRTADIPDQSCNNTVTVTSRGSVVIRLSWEQPVAWDDHACRHALNACTVICQVIENSC
jgi:hypothetical protein